MTSQSPLPAGAYFFRVVGWEGGKRTIADSPMGYVVVRLLADQLAPTDRFERIPLADTPRARWRWDSLVDCWESIPGIVGRTFLCDVGQPREFWGSTGFIEFAAEVVLSL